jgi:ankyrin repeat protein
MNGDRTSVELLLASGADPAATNEEGRSVLDLATESGDELTVDRIRSALQAAP